MIIPYIDLFVPSNYIISELWFLLLNVQWLTRLGGSFIVLLTSTFERQYSYPAIAGCYHWAVEPH